MREASAPPVYTRSVAFTKSSGRALGISTNFCGLRSVSGNQRALNLQHDAVSGAEGVRDIGQGEGDPVGPPGFEGHWLFEALAVLAAEGLAAHQLLIAAHRQRGGGPRRCAASGIDIDQLDHEIGIGG